MQVDDRGVIEDVVHVLLEDKIFDGSLAVILGEERVLNGVTGVGHSVVGVADAGRDIGGGFVDDDTGESIGAADGLVAGLTIDIATRDGAVVLAHWYGCRFRRWRWRWDGRGRGRWRRLRGWYGSRHRFDVRRR